MAAKKAYLWNSDKLQFEERERSVERNFNCLEYLNKQITDEEEKRETKLQPKLLEELFKIYLKPLILLIGSLFILWASSHIKF